MAQDSNIKDVSSTNLLELTKELVEIPSVSYEETQIADFVESKLSAISHLETKRVGNNLIAQTQLQKDQRILLGGHLDTVPHRPEFGISENSGVLSGPGTVDMKGGIAILLALANVETQNRDLTFLFYAKEEVASTDSGLKEIEDAHPDLLQADAAILLEPTGGVAEAGCQGTMKLLLHLEGKRAHTARAWKGINAIHRLAPILVAIDEYEARKVDIEGCEFIEALQVVSIGGGGIGNVLPDAVEVLINVRFAPDKDSKTALAEVTELISSALSSPLEVIQLESQITEGDTLQVVDVAEPAMPSLSDPILSQLTNQVSEIRAKLGWTDVSYFYNKNIPALNFGPGNPELAHTSEEEISGDELLAVYETLKKFIV